jgi:hypothetical protein
MIISYKYFQITLVCCFGVKPSLSGVALRISNPCTSWVWLVTFTLQPHEHWISFCWFSFLLEAPYAWESVRQWSKRKEILSLRAIRSRLTNLQSAALLTELFHPFYNANSAEFDVNFWYLWRLQSPELRHWTFLYQKAREYSVRIIWWMVRKQFWK